MAAAWACVLDYGQAPKVTVVLDKATFTRELIEASGFFALQLPTRAMATLTVGVGYGQWPGRARQARATA